MVYQIEKMLKESGDKISGSERGDVENALADAKKALESNDKAQMDKARETLTQASHKLAEQMYKAAQPQGGAQAGPSEGGRRSGTGRQRRRPEERRRRDRRRVRGRGRQEVKQPRPRINADEHGSKSVKICANPWPRFLENQIGFPGKRRNIFPRPRRKRAAVAGLRGHSERPEVDSCLRRRAIIARRRCEGRGRRQSETENRELSELATNAWRLRPKRTITKYWA